MKIKGTEVGTGRPLICVPVLEKTKEEVIKEVEYLVKSDADMIEWRLDAFEHYTDYNEVREILQQIAPLLKKKLFLYTFRTAKQGGVVSVDRETLNDLHDLAAESEWRNMRQSGSGKFKKRGRKLWHHIMIWKEHRR